MLGEQDNFLLITHKNPDGDTLGSACALCHALKRIGKTAWLFPNDQVTRRYRDKVVPYFAPVGYRGGFIVAVDTATERMFAPGFAGEVDFCVDHHPTNSHYAKNYLVCDEKSACGEAVLEIIKELCGSVSKEEAEFLYTAISTDTGCFRYSNTNADTFRAAAEIVEAGADITELNTRLFRKSSIARLKLEGLIFSTMSFHRDGKVVVAVITKEMMAQCDVTEDDCDDLAGLAGRAEGGVVSITIREQDDGTSKVSLRTTKEVSATEICAVFGGGGHAMASGCTIQASPEKAKELLLAVVDEVYK